MAPAGQKVNWPDCGFQCPSCGIVCQRAFQSIASHLVIHCPTYLLGSIFGAKEGQKETNHCGVSTIVAYESLGLRLKQSSSNQEPRWLQRTARKCIQATGGALRGQNGQI